METFNHQIGLDYFSALVLNLFGLDTALKAQCKNESTNPLHGCRSLCAGITSRLGVGFLFMKNLPDITGKIFGKLTVISIAPKSIDGRKMWNCFCSCGNNITVSQTHLTTGHRTTCGCNSLAIGIRSKTHGKRNTREYDIWKTMKQHCLNPKNKRFKDYGGRGIKVCDRWKDSFENFISDMGEKPTPSHSIERKNNDGNYEPDNCVWATKIEQNNNTSQNRFITYKGKTQTMAQWARETGIDWERVRQRLNKGWTVEETLETPIRRCKRS